MADLADLDGALQVSEDPLEGMTLERGRLRLPVRPGLGVMKKKEANG